MRSARFWLSASLLVLALALVACEGSTSCQAEGATISPNRVELHPGDTATFEASVFEDTKNEAERDNDLIGARDHRPATECEWEVEGPAKAKVVKSGANTCVFTAPDTPGKYLLHVTTLQPIKGQKTAFITVVDAKTPIEESSEKPAPQAADAVKVLAVGNTLGIKPGGTAPSFTIKSGGTVTDVMTYHYIDSGGPAPGTIGLKGSDGKVYGPWQCSGLEGQGGVKNAFWVAKPNEKIPAGTYTIVDSSPGTWSTNDTAKGLG
ncbi:MAG: hypothetical protein FDZ75_08195, partial [Actinobacteria bacterium]